MQIENLVGALLACAMIGGTSAASAQKTYELTFSTYLPPAYEYAWKPMENFVNKVQERSGGRVKINVFHSAQLFDGYEELPALSRGDVDIVNMTPTTPGVRWRPWAGSPRQSLSPGMPILSLDW